MDAMDTIGAETRIHHREVMGRWRKCAIEASNSKSFWLTISLLHPVVQVVEHFRHFLQSHEKLVQQRGVGALALLVHGKADEFMKEFDDLLESRDAFLAITEVRAPASFVHGLASQ